MYNLITPCSCVNNEYLWSERFAFGVAKVLKACPLIILEHMEVILDGHIYLVHCLVNTVPSMTFSKMTCKCVHTVLTLLTQIQVLSLPLIPYF